MRLESPAVSMTWSSQILSYNVRGLAITDSSAGRRDIGGSGAIYAERGEDGSGRAALPTGGQAAWVVLTGRATVSIVVRSSFFDAPSISGPTIAPSASRSM